MGTIILSDAPSVGDNLEYMDMLTIPVKENLVYRYNAYSNIETYNEGDGEFSASQLENMVGIGDPLLGRNPQGSGGIFGGGIIIPASETNSGRPILDMQSLPSDTNQNGRFYLFPQSTREILQNTAGLSLFFVGSVNPSPSARIISIGSSGTNPSSYGNLLDVGINSSNNYFIRLSNQGEAYTESSNGIPHTGGVKVYSLVFNSQLGTAILSSNGIILASVEIPIKSPTAWSTIGSIRLCGVGGSAGSQGLFLDFAAYKDSQVDVSELENYFKNIHKI